MSTTHIFSLEMSDAVFEMFLHRKRIERTVEEKMEVQHIFKTTTRS